MRRTVLFLAWAATAIASTPPDAEAWESHTREKRPGIRDGVVAMAVDPSGDPVAFGYLVARPGIGFNFGTAKFDGATGTEIWRSVLDISIADRPRALALDGAGNPFVGGRTRGLLIGEGFFSVFKLSGTDGAELWGRELKGAAASTTNPLANRVWAVVVDFAGDLIAAGAMENVVGDTTFTVVKLSGIDGAELWHVGIDGSQPAFFGDQARAVALDASGDVIAAGRLLDAQTSCDLFVVRLAASDGSELWRRVIDGTGECDFADSLAVSDGDVFVGGFLDSGSALEGSVWKLAGSDGSVLWQANGMASVAALSGGDVVVASGTSVQRRAGSDGAVIWGTDVGFAVGLLIADSSGDVLVSGNLPDRAVIRAKLRGTDGEEVWTHSTARLGPGADLALDSAGDLFVGGSNPDPSSVDERFGRFAVVKLRGADGIDLRPLKGSKLVLRDALLDALFSKLVFLAKDRGAVWTDPGGADDPTLHGATLEVLNPGTGETLVLSLPAGKWERAAPHGNHYRYRDPSGPCRRVIIRPGRLIRAVCKGPGVAKYTLDEPSQGTLAVRLTTGAIQYCAVFGGEVISDTSTTSGPPVGLFVAERADRPPSCPFP